MCAMTVAPGVHLVLFVASSEVCGVCSCLTLLNVLNGPVACKR